MSISNIITSLSGTHKKLGKNIEGSSYYCILIILLPIDYSYSLYMIILILSYYFFEKEERENRRNDKNKQCNEIFFFGKLWSRREAESVLDTAPNT